MYHTFIYACNVRRFKSRSCMKECVIVSRQLSSFLIAMSVIFSAGRTLLSLSSSVSELRCITVLKAIWTECIALLCNKFDVLL